MDGGDRLFHGLRAPLWFWPIGASVSLAAEQVFQLTETSILAGDMASTLSPEEQAVATADFSLRGLLADSARLEDVRGQAAQISLQIELPALARD